MKRYFFTGLALILPIIVTFAILQFFLSFLTKPFSGITQLLILSTIQKYPFLSFIENPILIFLVSQLLILTLLFCFIVFIGYLGQWFLMRGLIRRFDTLMHKIPVANKVYKAVQELMHTLFSHKSTLSLKPVEIAFPFPESKAVGFVMREDVLIQGQEYSAVFVTGTPYPVIGFLVLQTKDKLPPLTLSGDQSIQFLISCGMIYSTKKQ